jgi:hypothetical protein
MARVRLFAVLALLPALASAEPAKPASARRAHRVKRTAATKAPDAREEQRHAPPAAATPQLARSTVDGPTHLEAPAAPVPPVTPVTRDAPIPEASAPARRVTITVNPAPIALGRYGGNLEFVAARHHAIVVSGYAQTFAPWLLRQVLPRAVDVGSGPPARPGGEIGYRFYTGTRGAHGLFVGPSAIAMPLVAPRVGTDLRAEVVSFQAYGAALDVGVQAITDAGFTVGGGLGVMYLAYTPPASVAPPPGVPVPSFPQPHVLPRLLIAAGWSF